MSKQDAHDVIQENNPKSSNTITERLISIIHRIETLHINTPLEKAIKDFIHLTKEWEQFCSSDTEKNEDLISRYIKACDTFIQQRDWALWANYKKKEEICTLLDELLNKSVDQGSIDRFTELRGEWKNTGPVPERERNQLWKKYRTLCKQIYEKNFEFYQDKEKAREENLKIKESLCTEIESLTNPENWAEATEFVIKIQKGWDAIGPVPKEQSAELWTRFQKVCKEFFERRKQFYKDIRIKQQENFEKKKELCELVEELKDSTKWKEISTRIQQIQKQWQQIGPVPRKKEKALWQRFRAACDYFFNSQQNYFNELEKERPENLKKKEELCKIVESLEDIPVNEQYQTIINAQEEWKKIGPVPKDTEDSIWKRFRKPIDEFFENRNNQKEEVKKKQEQNEVLKEELCIEAESLNNSSDWRNTSERLKQLQSKWKQIGLLDQNREQALWHRFHAACDAFFERFNEYKQESNQEKEENLEKKLDLCIQAEIIAGIKLTKEEEDERANWQLKKLTENFWFKIMETDRWEDKAQKLKELQREWKEIGPVPPKMHEKIWKRFQNACNYFFQNRRKKDD